MVMTLRKATRESSRRGGGKRLAARSIEAQNDEGCSADTAWGNLGGEADFDVLAFEGRADAANDFADGQFFAEQDEGAVFESASGTEEILFVGGVVTVDSPSGEIAFEGGVGSGGWRAGTSAEGFCLEAIEKRLETFEFGSGDDDDVFAGFAKRNLVQRAVIADAIDVAEEVEDPGFVCSDGAKNAGPDPGGLLAANGFAVFVRFGELEADRADIVAEIERLDFEKYHRAIRPRGAAEIFW